MRVEVTESLNGLHELVQFARDLSHADSLQFGDVLAAQEVSFQIRLDVVSVVQVDFELVFVQVL